MPGRRPAGSGFRLVDDVRDLDIGLSRLRRARDARRRPEESSVLVDDIAEAMHRSTASTAKGDLPAKGVGEHLSAAIRAIGTVEHDARLDRGLVRPRTLRHVDLHDRSTSGPAEYIDGRTASRRGVSVRQPECAPSATEIEVAWPVDCRGHAIDRLPNCRVVPSSCGRASGMLDSASGPPVAGGVSRHTAGHQAFPDVGERLGRPRCFPRQRGRRLVSAVDESTSGNWCRSRDSNSNALAGRGV